MKIKIIIWVVILLSWNISSVLACGDPTDPNGCSTHFYYSLHNVFLGKTTCMDSTVNMQDSSNFPPSQVLSQQECEEMKKLKAQYYKKGMPKDSGYLKIEDYADALVQSELLKKTSKYLARYPLRNLFDGDPRTVWVGPVYGAGIGLYLVIGSNDEEQVFNKIKVVNGCARDKQMFQNNNRVKGLVIYRSPDSFENITLSDTIEPQIVELKKTFSSHVIVIAISDIYRGVKYNDTCLSELSFIGKDNFEWPKPPQYLIEMEFLDPSNSSERIYDVTDYTYPSYTFFMNNKKVASLNEGHDFAISPKGLAFIQNTMEGTSLLINIPEIKGKIDSSMRDPKYVAFENGGPLLNSTPDEDMAIPVGWIDKERFCLMKINQNANDIFYLYQAKDNRFHYLTKREIPHNEIQKIAKTYANSIGLGAKEYVYYRQFCPSK